MAVKLELYKVFKEVAEAGNITAAAQALYISQSAVSQSIKQLEGDLQTRLFARNSRGVTLTADGKLLYEYVRSAIGLLETGEAKLSQTRELQMGHLTIGASDTVTSQFLLPYLDSFHKQYPAIHIQIVSGRSHKVLGLPHKNGKLDAAELRALVATFYADDNHDHMVFPGMVYISQPTETGMLYSKAELTAVYDICRAYGLPLFIDGARLGYGLVCDSNDVTLPELARLCDVFYIGGTKVGALFGEAVVIMNPALKKDFRFMMKQRGGMLAKGRLLGIQFDTLFTDDLYFKIARNAIDKAFQIRDIFVSNGYPLLFDSPTNQQYPIIPDDELAILGKEFGYEYWTRVDATHSGVRFCGSWATTQENVDALRAAVNALKK